MAVPKAFDVQLGGFGGQPDASIWWTGRALDEAAAISLARSDAVTAWTVLSALRGTHDPLPGALLELSSCNETSSTLPSVRLHPALTGGVPICGHRTAVTSDEIGRATLALFRAWLADEVQDLAGRTAMIYATAKTDDRIRRMNCSIVGRRGICDTPRRFRTALVAAAIASDEIDRSGSTSRRHDIDVPESATLRAILGKSLKTAQTEDLAIAAALMRRLGLSLVAEALEAREETPATGTT